MRTSAPSRTVRIELLALDLSTCGRCTRTSTNLDEALAQAAGRLRSQGVAVEVTKTVVVSEDQAVRLRFVSSPTIRVDGRDIALELRESDCRDCGDLCGCHGGVACRVWVWEGREHIEAPVPLIVDAVLAAASSPPAAAPDEGTPFRLPENLRRFLREKGWHTRGAGEGCCGVPAGEPCCAPTMESSR
jgi:hypothetical protein